MMKKIFFIAITLALMLSGCGSNGQKSLMVTIQSDYPMQKSIDIYAKAMEARGYKLSGIIDHTKIAKDQNIYLLPTKSLIFNDPKRFSALLTCNPSMAIDLPIRVSVYSKLGGAVALSYTQPEYWSLKHNIKDKNCLAIIDSIARDFNTVADSIKNKSANK